MAFSVLSDKASPVQVWAVQVVSSWTLRLQDGEWSGHCRGAQNVPGGQIVSEVTS